MDWLPHSRGVSKVILGGIVVGVLGRLKCVCMCTYMCLGVDGWGVISKAYIKI